MRLRSILFSLPLLLLITITPAFAIENHQDGQIRVRWGTENQYLKPGVALSQEFTPTILEGMVDGAPFRWSNQYHWNFCWQGTNSLTYGGMRCGYVGFGLGSKSGNTYFGNFDFALFNGLDFQKVSNDSNLSCRKSNENGIFGETKTYYVNCWYPISIQMNTTYALSVQAANDSSAPGDNWWSATLTNKKTNESVTIGRLKGFGNSFSDQLAMLETVVFYDGDKKACDAVPVMDLMVSPLTASNNVKSKFLNYSTLSCVRAVAYPQQTQNENLMIRLGGSSPLSRDPSYIAGGSTATATVRRPRLNTSWTRPKDVIPGLSEVRVRGYFRDNPQFFSDAERLLITSTDPDQIRRWLDGNEPAGDVSIWWGGYFIPDESGPWDFRLTSDDASFLWLGTSAVLGYLGGTSSALIALPGPHATQSKSNSVYLEKDKVYPFRIQYGNEGGLASFNLEVKSPSHKTDWDQNLQGLIWHTNYAEANECTNYGISYTLAQSLGYGTFDVPGCGDRNPAKPAGSSNIKVNKPATPTFSAVNFNGNSLNVEINLGSSGSIRPDRVLLVAPKLGIGSTNPLLGKFEGDKAIWAIKLNEALGGVAIPLEIVSEKDGVKSEPLVGSYQAPQVTESLIAQEVPDAPKNFKSRVLSDSALITVSVPIKSGAIASKAFLYSKDLKISKKNPLPGDVYGDKALIEVPIKSSMIGKKYKVNIYLANAKGSSPEIQATLPIPAPAKVATLLPPTPKSGSTKTIICTRTTQTRTFSGAKCPPGWKEQS